MLADPPGSYDVIVVGGGMVGASIAYGLSKLGRRVVVLDEGDGALRSATMHRQGSAGGARWAVRDRLGRRGNS